MDDALMEIAPVEETADAEEQRAELRKLGNDWIARIEKAEDNEKDWIDDATKAETAYSCNDKDAELGFVPDFNILHSNIETIIPSLYNSTPKPDIRPRHGSNHDGVKAAADVYERAAAAAIDDGALDTEMEDLVRDAELAGRGIIWLKFDAEISDAAVRSPEIIYDSVSWRDFRMGPAKKWRDVPWVARLHTLAGTRLLDLSDTALIEMQIDPNQDRSDLEQDERDIWEVWDRDSREVLFIEADTGLILKRTPDPLGLKGFFPCPRPTQPLGVTGKMTPICPYRAYETLASELDLTTRRINALLDLLKVRGLIAGGAAADLEQLSAAEDGELIVSSDLAGLVATGGLDKGIMWWPVEVIITVIRELMQQREAIKANIYEVTGISDIVRGASNAAETATAQQIKTQWGSLRIKRLQGMVQRTVREVFLLTVEIMAGQFPPEHIARMAGVELTPELAEMLARPFDHLRIDVETDSTIRADLTMQRDEMSAFLAATGQFLQVAQPIMAQEPKSIAPLMEIYGSFARQFNLGKGAEDALDTLVTQSKAQAESGEDEQQKQKAEEEQERLKAMQEREFAMKEAETQAKVQESHGKVANEARKLDLEERKLNMEEINRLAEMEGDEPTDPTAALTAMFEGLTKVIADQGNEITEGQANLAQLLMEGQERIAQLLTGKAA